MSTVTRVFLILGIAILVIFLLTAIASQTLWGES
jgi:hypothetical protein